MLIMDKMHAKKNKNVKCGDVARPAGWRRSRAGAGLRIALGEIIDRSENSGYNKAKDYRERHR